MGRGHCGGDACWLWVAPLFCWLLRDWRAWRSGWPVPSLLRELAASLDDGGAATLLAVWACRLRAGMAGALALAGLADRC
ncbi:MAG: hypothetical protein U1F87_06960 [Kiritimatiellia bacterium]